MHPDTRQLHHLSRAFRILFIYFFLYLVVIALFFISPFTFFIMDDIAYNEPLFIFAAFLGLFLLPVGIYHYREATRYGIPEDDAIVKRRLLNVNILVLFGISPGMGILFTPGFVVMNAVLDALLTREVSLDAMYYPWVFITRWALTLAFAFYVLTLANRPVKPVDRKDRILASLIGVVVLLGLVPYLLVYLGDLASAMPDPVGVVLAYGYVSSLIVQPFIFIMLFVMYYKRTFTDPPENV